MGAGASVIGRMGIVAPVAEAVPETTLATIRRDVGVQTEDSRAFKSELCKYWKKGCCAYGLQCTFAHGREELRFNR